MSDRYVWEKCNKDIKYYMATGYNDVMELLGSKRISGYDSNGNRVITIGKNIQISQSTGAITITNKTTYTLNNYSSGANFGAGYVSVTASGGQIWYCSSWTKVNSGFADPAGIKGEDVYNVTSEPYSYQDYYYVKGNLVGYVSSDTSNTYPQNFYDDAFWYSYQGTDNIDPSSVNLPSEIHGGNSIIITISPSENIIYSSTINYLYQYSFNESQWITLTTSSISQFNLAIPKGTKNVQVRVLASDNIGFTSSTYVESDLVSVINGDPPSIKWSYESNPYDMGEITEPFTVNYEIYDPDYGDKLLVNESVKDESGKEIISNKIENSSSGTKLVFDLLNDEGNFQKVPSDSQSSVVLSVSDNYDLKSEDYKVLFIKKINEVTITLNPSLKVSGDITNGVVYVNGYIPNDADFSVKVTNNANDEEPVWQDITHDVLNGQVFNFENPTALNGSSFNFIVHAKRGSSQEGGFIDEILGAFD